MEKQNDGLDWRECSKWFLDWIKSKVKLIEREMPVSFLFSAKGEIINITVFGKNQNGVKYDVEEEIQEMQEMIKKLLENENNIVNEVGEVKQDDGDDEATAEMNKNHAHIKISIDIKYPISVEMIKENISDTDIAKMLNVYVNPESTMGSDWVLDEVVPHDRKVIYSVCHYIKFNDPRMQIQG